MPKIKSLASVLMVFFVAFYLYSCGGGGGGGSSTPAPSNNPAPIIHNDNGSGGPGTNGNPPIIDNESNSTTDNNSASSPSPNFNFIVQPGVCDVNNFQWAGTITGKYVEIDKGGWVYYNVPDDAVYEIATTVDNTTYKTSILAKKITINDTCSSIQPLTWLSNKLNTIGHDVSYGYGIFYNQSALANNHFYFFNQYTDYLDIDNDEGTPTTRIFNINLKTHDSDNTSLFNYQVFPIWSSTDNNTYFTGPIGVNNNKTELLVDFSKESDVNNIVYSINTTDNTTAETPIDDTTVKYLQPFTESNGYLYAAAVNSNGNIVLNVIDKNNGVVLRSIGTDVLMSSDITKNDSKVFMFGRAVASYDGNYVYVPALVIDGSHTYPFLLKIDTSTNSVNVISVYAIKGWHIGDIAVSPGGKYVYVLSEFDSVSGADYLEMTVINIQTLAQKAFKVEIPGQIDKRMWLYNYETFYSTTNSAGMGMEISKDGKSLYIPVTLATKTSDNNVKSYVLRLDTDVLNQSVQ